MGVSSAENTLEKTMTLGDFFAFIVPKIGCFSTNVFVKPNEQNRACSSYAMARKRRMKSNFFFVCDTCDSKKTTSLLEGARYAPACARGLMLLSPLRFCCDHLVVCFVVLLCHLDMPTLHLHKKMLYTFVSQCLHCVFGDFENKSAVFRDFFTLWGFFNPYTYRRSV